MFCSKDRWCARFNCLLRERSHTTIKKEQNQVVCSEASVVVALVDDGLSSLGLTTISPPLENPGCDENETRVRALMYEKEEMTGKHTHAMCAHTALQ